MQLPSKLLRFLAFLLTIFVFNSTFAKSPNWKWEGLEIIGLKKVSRSQIVAFIPLEIGTVYKTDLEKWNGWCEAIKTRFDFLYTRCSAVRYNNFKAFFVVEIVEKGDEFRLAFRNQPEGRVKLATAEIVKEFDDLQKRMWSLFEQGKGVAEDASAGYLDYADAEMSSIVQKLVKLVPPYKKNLLEVIEHDRDANKRGKAATLLNWALNTEDSIRAVYSLLNDPAELVRNNISRFMLHYVDRVNDPTLRREVVSSLSKQLWWPSHGDRNKAIYGLLEIVNKHPQDREHIRLVALQRIQFLVDHSILSNVKEPAEQLLALLKKKN